MKTTIRQNIGAILNRVSARLQSIAPAGKPQGQEELVRSSNAWRDGYNPLRGLIISRLVSLFEQAAMGNNFELQWMYQIIERRFPTLKALISRRTSAIVKLEWDVKIGADIKPGQEALAESQRAFLADIYAGIENMRDAIKFLALAEFRGYSILQKHRDPTGRIVELHWLPQWNWVRNGMFGDWYWNKDNNYVNALSLGDENRIGGGLPREDFLIREVPSSINEIAAIAFVNSSMARKDWAGFIELIGLHGCVITMPERVPAGKEDDYKADAAKVAASANGALPYGSTVSFPTKDLESSVPFKDFLNYQQEDVVLAGTGGKLTMLSGNTGIGKGPAEEHADVFEDIAEAEADDHSEVFQRDLDKPALAAQFPGQPVLAYFQLRAADEIDAKQEIDNAVALSAVWSLDTEEVEERVGWKIEEKELPPALGGPPPGGQRASGASSESSGLTSPDDSEDAPASRQADKTANLAGMRNRAMDGPAIPGHPIGQPEPSIYSAAAADLAPLRARLERILAIEDPIILADKLRAFRDSLPALLRDLNADPELERVLDKQLTGAFFSGLTSKPKVRT